MKHKLCVTSGFFLLDENKAKPDLQVALTKLISTTLQCGDCEGPCNTSAHIFSVRLPPFVGMSEFVEDDIALKQIDGINPLKSPSGTTFGTATPFENPPLMSVFSPSTVFQSPFRATFASDPALTLISLSIAGTSAQTVSSIMTHP